jgi:AbrB family looped-hinge helix DNA binding protein
MELLDMRTAKITDKGQIAIPKDIRKIKGFGTGSKIAILAYEDRIELRPLKQVSIGMQTALASEKILKKAWNTKEDDRIWKNL